MLLCPVSQFCVNFADMLKVKLQHFVKYQTKEINRGKGVGRRGTGGQGGGDGGRNQ